MEVLHNSQTLDKGENACHACVSMTTKKKFYNLDT